MINFIVNFTASFICPNKAVEYFIGNAEQMWINSINLLR